MYYTCSLVHLSIPTRPLSFGCTHSNTFPIQTHIRTNTSSSSIHHCSHPCINPSVIVPIHPFSRLSIYPYVQTHVLTNMKNTHTFLIVSKLLTSNLPVFFSNVKYITSTSVILRGFKFLANSAVTQVTQTRSNAYDTLIGPVNITVHRSETVYKADLSFTHSVPEEIQICFQATLDDG